MTISDLKQGQTFAIAGVKYRLIRFWLEDGMPWQYLYQNLTTNEHAISTGQLEVEPQ